MTSWNIDFLNSTTNTNTTRSVQSNNNGNHVLASAAVAEYRDSNEKTKKLRRRDEKRIRSGFALIILNQPFSFSLLERVWNASDWRCCADGGANRLYDLLRSVDVDPQKYLPDLIKGDLDSLRDDVKRYYKSQNIEIIQDADQDSTDLMKCVQALESTEQAIHGLVPSPASPFNALEAEETEEDSTLEGQYDIIILGGLSGRLDQTIHTLSYLHKLRKKRKRVYAVTDDNIGWVLDSGEHFIQIDHELLGPTCGLLPVGIDETILSTRGLKWNLTKCHSGFDGLVSTSNHLVPGEDVVWVETTRPIWWTVELRPV